MSLQEIIKFFNTNYPCDHFFETHVEDIRYVKDDICKCIIKTDMSRDIVFAIKQISEDNGNAIIELTDDCYSIADDDDGINFYDILKDYGNCKAYEILWADSNNKKHSYYIVGQNTYGNNNGLYLKEI